MEKFFGGSPLVVILKLALISLIVGVILAALGLEPFDVIRSVQNLVVHIYNLGFETFDRMFNYFLVGAVLVFPIWLLTRLFKSLNDKK